MPICKECLQPFEKKRKVHLFCKAICRTRYWMKRHPRINLVVIDKIIDKKL
jgi:hypothetical protein